MADQVECPACHTRFAVRADDAGKVVTCPRCPTGVPVPSTLAISAASDKVGWVTCQVLAIAVVLIPFLALILMALLKVSDPAKKMLSASNLRQLAISMHNYHN